MARSVTQVLGQLFWHLIMKIYQIWWLLPLGVAPKSLGNFFIELFRERGFSGQRSLRMKNQLYKICSCYVSLECKFYTDLKIQKNLCLKINIWGGFAVSLILFASHVCIGVFRKIGGFHNSSEWLFLNGFFLMQHIWSYF